MLKRAILCLSYGLSSTFPKLYAKAGVHFSTIPKKYPRTQKEEVCFEKAEQIYFSSGCVANQWPKEPIVDRPTILLVHGWESRGTTFHVLIDQLLDENYNVIAWNAPAHGASKGKHTNLIEFAKTLAHDLEEKQIKPAAIIGHSMGGAATGLLSKYMKHPEVIVIISAFTNLRTIFKISFDKMNVAEKAREAYFDHLNQLSPHHVDSISLDAIELEDHVKPLIIHDDKDKEIPNEHFENLRAHWPQAKAIQTSGLGHRRILRDEALMHQITDFVKSHIS